MKKNERRKTLYGVFMGLENAYKMVKREALWHVRRMHDVGVNGMYVHS